MIETLNKNIFFSIRGIDYKKTLINNYYLLLVINFIPIKLILVIFLYCSNIKYIYQINNITFYSEINNFIINPLLKNIYITDIQNSKKCVLNKIKPYDNNVPLWIIFNNEKIDFNDNTYIEILFFNSKESIKYKISEISNKTKGYILKKTFKKLI